MRVSVVIATYNRATLLSDCLAQLAIQPFEPGDEVIVVDNGSTDDTAALLSRVATTFPAPLRRLCVATPGKTPALNAGISAARGALLALIDDDIMIAPDWIDTVRRLFADPELSLVGGRVDPRWEAPAPRWLRLERDGRYGRMASPLALQHYGSRQPLGARTAVGGNLVVRRQVLQAVGGFAPYLGRIRGTLMCGEDHDFCQRVVAGGYRAIYDPALMVRHWVPAHRTTVRYFVRWFFWSGVTNATMDSGGNAASGFLNAPRYVWGRLVRSPFTMLREVFRGDHSATAAAAMDVAFSAGYIWARARSRYGRQEIGARHQQAPQLPAPAQSPAIPIPGGGPGSSSNRLA